ncbi:cation transporter [Candidatus Azambacteria bacterium]|nr:cation transporter [Candidatus Azambacteria bacterium]MBI3685058.1 cation transporter [Candidatus Azambacteria bacterium]
MVKKTYNIEGMHCGACSTGIELFLSNTEGVASAKVNYETKKGEVEYDETKIKDADVIKVIEEAGFKAAVKS